MENFSSVASLTPEDGVLASFGSGNGSRGALKRASTQGGRAVPKGSARYERSRANRIAAVPGRGRKSRQAAAAEYNRLFSGSRRPTNRQAQAALDALVAATGYR